MEANGSCHCGQIKFKADVSEEAIVCHCGDCQVLSGSAFRINVKTPAKTFVLEKGELRAYRKTAESGDIRVQTFCANCGTPIYSSVEENPENLFIRIGTIKERASIRPAVQIWQRSALSNFGNLDDIQGSSEQQVLKSK